MLYRKASPIILEIAVPPKTLAIQTADVCLEGDNLIINKYIEFSLTSRLRRR